MALAAGTRLGPHEILSLIGAGGMGEVYKARDTRLDRIVAIKVLPAHLAGRTDVRERFEREARTVASLRHSHICVLHDIGEQDGAHFLVMEYLEGETLAQRLRKGPLPLEQVLRYAMEISDALDRAHRSGVIHRDIKPANVMLTKDGTKVLDFGLAKLKEAAKPNVPASQLPTAPNTLTNEGTILGTLQYMAPEQVEGKVEELDARTDIFSFGATVYEMATGQKAFEGKTQASVIGKIMQSDPPPMSSLQPMTPPALDRVVNRCLGKDPDDRWQTASDLTEALKWIRDGSLPSAITASSAAATPAGSVWRRRLAFSAIGLAAWAATAFVIWTMKPAAPPLQVTRTVIPLGPDERIPNGSILPLAISPDGSHLVYVAQKGGQVGQLFVRSVDSLDARPIPGTENADHPFFSPDGQWIGFLTGSIMKKVPMNGGPVTTLLNIVTPRGASWGSDDRIVVTATNNSGLSVVSAAGGAAEVLTTLAKGDSTHRWPEVLPGAKAMVYVASSSASNYDSAQIVAQRLDTGEGSVLIQGGTFPHYVPTGHLVYYRAGTIMAVPFDVKRLEVKGSPVPVVEGVMASGSGTGGAKFAVSANGTLVYFPGGASGAQNRLVWVDRKGIAQPIESPPHGYGGNSGPKLSPGGKTVAVMIQEQGSDAWVYDFARDTLTRLTFDGSLTNIAWTPDGKRVVYTSSKSGPVNIFWKPADGSGAEETLVTSDYQLFTGSFTPDGRIYIYAQNSPKTGRDIWYESVEDRKPHVFLQTQFNETAPRLSPDGRYVAYSSDESGRNEIYVQPFPGPGGKYQISTEGGRELTWGANGEIFYRNGEKMMAVEVKTQPALQVGKAQMLFEAPYLVNSGAGAYYDVTADGQRFVMLKGPEQATPATQINVVLNWFEELKQKVPVR